MTSQRISEIYQELEGMRVLLDHSGHRGATYLLEKLQECRRYQDRLLTLTAEVERALSSAKRKVRACKTALAVAGLAAEHRSALHAELAQAQDLLDELRGVQASLNYARQNMRIADSDVRLASGLVDLQHKLGEVRPPDSPADRAVQEVIPFTADPPSNGPVAAPVDDISAFFESVEEHHG